MVQDRQEADAALYETRRREKRLLAAAREVLGALLPVLKWVGAAMVVVSCVLMVYLGVVLLARFAVWATFP